MMKIRIVALACLTVSTMLVGAAVAAGPTLLQPGASYAPQSEVAPVPMPMPLPAQAYPAGQPIEHSTSYGPVESFDQPVVPYVEGRVVELYPNVVYRDLRRVHPCAVPYLIDVPMPPSRRSRGCTTCEPTCVTIKVCVPPCTTPCVKVRRHGRKLIYDFGKYEVNVLIRRTGRIVVNYDA